MLNLTISKLRFIAKERNTDGYQNISKKKKKIENLLIKTTLSTLTPTLQPEKRTPTQAPRPTSINKIE